MMRGFRIGWAAALAVGVCASVGRADAGDVRAKAVGAEPAPFVERAGRRAFSGRLIVQLRPADELARDHGGARGAELAELGRRRLEPMLLRRLPMAETFLIRVPEDEDENALTARLMASGAYAYVEPDWILSPIATPNDADFGEQWQHAVMQSELAWNTATGHGAIVCASCDTGVDLDHPDLAAALVPGVNTAGVPLAQVDGGEVDDINGHGTFVGGCMAAIGNNGIGVAGVGWSFGLMPVRVTDLPNGNASLSNIIEGAIWASENGARIMNCSYTGVQSASVQNAGATIKANGGLLFWAAGNDGEDLAGFDHADVVVVGASTPTDAKASFSAFGIGVDVFAPGTNVWSTRIGGSYGAGSGTSFASPTAAGVAALVWSIDPGLTPDEVQAALYAGCDDLGDPGDDDYWGHGRVNAYGSTQLISPPDAGPGAFARIAPAPGAAGTGIAVAFSWEASPDADWYVLQVDDDPGFASPVLDMTVFGTSLVAPFPLLSWETTYSWRVTAHNLLGSVPNTGGAATFSTGVEPAPGTFALVSPGEGATDVLPYTTLEWGYSSNALLYRVLVAEQGGSFSDPLIETSPSWQVQSHSISYGTLDWGTTYIWRVLSNNGAGWTVASPATGTFTTAPVPAPGAFALLTPVNLSINIPTGPSFSWSYALTASSYLLEIGGHPDFVSPLVSKRVYPDDQGSGGLAEQPVTHTFPPGTLPEGAPVYWRVTAENSVGTTLCEPSHFRFMVVPPGVCAGDINDDGHTNVHDFAQWLISFGIEEGATYAQGDLNGDGAVNVLDFALFLVDFGCDE